MNFNHIYGLCASIAVMNVLGGCSSDPITSEGDRYEEFNKAFIKDFGIPKTDHPWSQASRTTLTIISPTAASVQVYYEEDEELCLTGDITIQAGSSEIPFIIPDYITTFTVHANGMEYEVPVGTTLNLNEVRGRAFGTDIEYDRENKQYITSLGSEDDVKECVIRFTREMLTKVYFDKFKPGEDNLDKLSETGVRLYGRISGKVNDNSSPIVYMYPVYWSTKNSKYTAKDIKLYAASGTSLVKLNETCLENDAYGESPLAFHFTSGSLAYWHHNDFTPSYEGYSDINSNNTEAYPLTDYDYTIQSQGIRFNDAIPGTFRLGFGDERCSSDPFDNGYGFWKNNFWNVPMGKLWQSYADVVFYMPKDESGNSIPVKFKVWRKGDNGQYQWVERTRPAFFVGFSHPAPQVEPYKTYTMGSDERPDFCDVVYFVATEDSNTAIGHYLSISIISTGKQNTFTIAAEDLGGSHDWDFNDAVFSVKCVTKDISQCYYDKYCSNNEDWSRNRFAFIPQKSSSTEIKSSYVYEIEVTPLAAGGTMPIYAVYHGKTTTHFDDLIDVEDTEITYNDLTKRIADYYDDLSWTDGQWIIGTEMHKWLGQNATNSPVNAGNNVTNTGQSVKFYSYAETDAGYGLSEYNTPLGQFSVIVDRDNTLGIDTSKAFNPDGTGAVWNGYTPFDGILGDGCYQIGIVSEDKTMIAPQMIKVSGTWSWPKEGHNIKLAYPRFIEWVAGGSLDYPRWNNSQFANTEHITGK